MAINKDKCENWCKIMLDLTNATKELTYDELEYIKQKLTIAFAEIKIEQLEAKDDNKNTINM